MALTRGEQGELFEKQNIDGENVPAYFFHQGTNSRAYDYLGAHEIPGGYVFRVWAPNAAAVSVAGDFDGWVGALSMQRITEGGIWEARGIGDGFCRGARYKYIITAADGRRLYKADPFAFYSECPPGTASVMWDIPTRAWQDAAWMASRPNARDTARPINIYELQLSSWMRHDDGTLLSYIELAHELAPYVKQMGYTHIELLPIAEHPYDGSWGYQVTGYYSPTARHGTPQELMEFIDIMHGAGIGVILDWVPAHFPKDAHGLYEFDGMPLYEYQGADRIEHAGWGTRRFDVGRCEVESFLVSNACFWAEVYHADGLRVDAVASMLYLDYDRAPGEWVPNIYGDNRCLEAMAFFRKLNGTMAHFHPGVMMIAEESTAWGNLTSFDNDGLGFSFKWNMGWMNDALAYAEEDPIFRRYHHQKLTFSMMYAFGERYVLPISHDEVVHGKKSLLDRMPGDYWQKFAGTRAFFAYMMTHPGKKLIFMGCEIGQFREWDHASSIEWFLLDYEAHAKLQLYVAELDHLYLASPELWELDTSWDGFEWIDADNADQSIISFRRMSSDGGELVVIINFTPQAYEGYRVGVPAPAEYCELISSDSERYGGSGVCNTGVLRTEDIPSHGSDASLVLRIPPLGAIILKREKLLPPKCRPAAKAAAPTNKGQSKATGKTTKTNKAKNKTPATEAERTAEK